MKLTDLVGFQVSSLNDEHMVVNRNGEQYVISFECDHGDCCGFASISSTLLFNPNELKKNPVITHVEITETGSGYDEATVLITLFGEQKQIAQLSANAGSGSGWNYGACVKALCKPLQMNEEIVCW